MEPRPQPNWPDGAHIGSGGQPGRCGQQSLASPSDWHLELSPFIGAVSQTGDPLPCTTFVNQCGLVVGIALAGVIPVAAGRNAVLLHVGGSGVGVDRLS
jgi:hypothetical protein